MGVVGCDSACLCGGAPAARAEGEVRVTVRTVAGTVFSEATLPVDRTVADVSRGLRIPKGLLPSLLHDQRKLQLDERLGDLLQLDAPPVLELTLVLRHTGTLDTLRGLLASDDVHTVRAAADCLAAHCRYALRLLGRLAPEAMTVLAAALRIRDPQVWQLARQVVADLDPEEASADLLQLARSHWLAVVLRAPWGAIVAKRWVLSCDTVLDLRRSLQGDEEVRRKLGRPLESHTPLVWRGRDLDPDERWEGVAEGCEEEELGLLIVVP